MVTQGAEKFSGNTHFSQEASTVPIAYATAYLALFVRARLQPGESVLIHSGAGGVGMAAIRIALANGQFELVAVAKW